MRKCPQQFGFSLIELIIVIILAGALIGGSANILSMGFNTFFQTNYLVTANWLLSPALERITRELHKVRSKNDITAATSSSFSFIDIYNNTVIYQISGAQLLYGYGPNQSAPNQILIDGINTAVTSFQFYDSSGTLLKFPISDLTKIRYVTVSIGINYQNIQFATTIGAYLWPIQNP